MATQEIYIRNATDTEARGPFNAQQVADLAEAGQVTGDTLVYDATAEQWVALNSNAELMAVVFPEKKKLSLKAKEIKTLNKTDANAKEISVQDMLAAAEGRTEETSDKRDPEIAMMRAARVGMIGAIVTLVAAAAGEVLPATDALISVDFGKIMAQPLCLLGVADVALAVLLALGMLSLYPVVRFRAALGFGLMGFIFYAQGMSVHIGELALGCAGLYLCTVFTSLIPAAIAALAGMAGMGMLAWYFISH
jgi:hypothetical protein